MKAYSFTRRHLLKYFVATSSLSFANLSFARDIGLPAASSVNPDILAKDENFWASVAEHYDKTDGIINLEHGYWGKMAKSVQAHYIAATKMVNKQNSYYARKDYRAEHMESIHRIAKALGVHDDEIVLTRNATEAVHNLIRQYKGLKSGDAVLYADIDYPSFKTTMQWLEKARGVKALELVLPARANQSMILDKYIQMFDQHPDLKLILLTHVSNQHGLVLPVKQISIEAAKRGIDIICDNAQSWGIIDYKMSDICVDWAAFNLHKWIGAPIGVGALYMKRGSLDKIAPYPGEKDADNTKAYKRVHTATSNFAAFISVPAALDFHEAIGGKNKEARFRYLRKLWTDEISSLKNIEVLGGLDEASSTGMASFRLKGKDTKQDAIDLQQRIENEFGIFTVIRLGLASGACVRITPQVFSTPAHIAALVTALKAIDHSY